MKTAYRVLGIATLGLAFALQEAAGQTEADEAAADAVSTVSPVPQAELEPEPATASPANWFETRIAIEELADDGDFDAAIALGDRLLQLTRDEFGPASDQLADAHRLLANVLRRAGRFQAAEEEILTSIDILEQSVGPLSPDLIDPYTELGDNYGEAGDYTSAISAYGAARDLGRRNFGLLNQDQLVLIEDMTLAAERLGQIEEAGELQLEALTLVERNYGELSPEAIDARYQYAHWLREHGFYEDELRLYLQLERVIEQEYDDDPLMIVRLLRERAASYRQADIGDPLGLAGLYDAMNYLEEMTDPPPLLIAQVLTDIGDWLVEFSRTGSIGETYVQAWQLLGLVENGQELRRRWFEELHEVEMSSLSRRGLTTDPSDPEGFVVVYFTVDSGGRTRDIEVTESSPPGFKDSAVIRLMREARFRPRIADGELVSTRRAYRFEFRYDPMELE